MADGYVYRSRADLEAMGRRVIDKAAEEVLWQDESYSLAQQGSINDYTRHHSYAGSENPNYRIGRKAGGEISTEVLAGDDGKSEPIGQLVQNMVLTHMDHWEGAAAGEFVGYCGKLATAAFLQQVVALNLAEVMDAHLEIRRRQLTDAWQIGEDTIKVLDSLDAWCMSRKKSTQTVLTIVGAIAAVVVVAMAPESVPIGVKIGAEVVQGLGAALGTVPDLKDEPSPISGATVQEVIQSMTNALFTLQARVDEQEEKLVQALSAMSASMNAQMPKLMPVPPELLLDLRTAGLPEVEKNFYNR